MKKEELNNLRQLMKAKCPFAFRMPGGEISVYDKPSQAYLDVLMILWAEFPRGFIDIPFFLTKYMGMAVKDAERLCGRQQYALIKLWQINDKERLPQLRRLFEVLLNVTGVAFDEPSFLTAVQSFNIFLENSKIEERTISGAVVEFAK